MVVFVLWENADEGGARLRTEVGTQILFPGNLESGRLNQWGPSWDKMSTLELRMAFGGNGTDHVQMNSGKLPVQRRGPKAGEQWTLK